VATGKPKWTDRYFDPTSTLVEDRIVLFQASDFDDAVKQAEAEARRYCKATKYMNVYGQSVRIKFLGATDAFSMLDNLPTTRSEVYSTTAIVANTVRDASVVTKWWGKKERGPWQVRNKFLHDGILTKALTAMQQSGGKKAKQSGAKEIRTPVNSAVKKP
jgi:hypothetical protein